MGLFDRFSKDLGGEIHPDGIAELLAEATSGYEELGMESWAKRAVALAEGQSESSTRSMR